MRNEYIFGRKISHYLSAEEENILQSTKFTLLETGFRMGAVTIQRQQHNWSRNNILIHIQLTPINHRQQFLQCFYHWVKYLAYVNWHRSTALQLQIYSSWKYNTLKQKKTKPAPQNVNSLCWNFWLFLKEGYLETHKYYRIHQSHQRFSVRVWSCVILLHNLPTPKCSNSAISNSIRLKIVNRLMVVIIRNTYAPAIYILICPRTKT